MTDLNHRPIFAAQVPAAAAESPPSTTAKGENQRQHANPYQESEEPREGQTSPSPEMAKTVR